MNSKNSPKILTLDIGATHLRIAYVQEGTVLSKVKTRTPQVDFLDNLKQNINEFIKEETPEVIAVSVAGLVRSDGSVRFSNIPSHPLLAPAFFDDFAPKSRIINDASAAAYSYRNGMMSAI